MKAKLIKDRLFLRKVADSYTLHRIKDNILTIEGDSQYTIGGIDPFYKLSKQNCDELFGVVDVEKLAEKLSPNSSWKHGFIKGFNKALELNKDKVFTLEDMKKAYFKGDYDALYDGAYSEKENEFIQSLQQPTEIEVTFNSDEKDSDGCLILKRVV